VNTLNKQPRTNDKWWSSSLGVGCAYSIETFVIDTNELRKNQAKIMHVVFNFFFIYIAE
jgi:hypothetical protein